ncbi:MAG: YlmC/YmxH family sporulation protein [Bacillota bacterium]
MRFGELRSKEIVNLATGDRLGTVGEAELVIDEQSGRILSLVIRERRGLFARPHEQTVPWRAVKRIGPDLVILNLDEHRLY